jgi:D-alanyl-D-alanine carboxypeptidase/D-alanyl-D-alanine-endopeptidase (penicillin-binding protein 4)
LVVVTFLAAAPLRANEEQTQAGLDPRIVKIMKGPPYRHAQWGLLEVNPSTGRILHSLDDTATRFFEPGSTAKLFSVSATLDDLGFAHHLRTPV